MDVAETDNAAELLATVSQRLSERFAREAPDAMARALEALPLDDALASLRGFAEEPLVDMWPRLATDRAADLLVGLDPRQACSTLGRLLPTDAARLLGAMEDEDRERLLGEIDRSVAPALKDLMSYPAESAGRLMETRFISFSPDMTAAMALDRVRNSRGRHVDVLYLVDDNNCLIGHLRLQQLALARTDSRLGDLGQGITAMVRATDSRDEVVHVAEESGMPELPVVDVDGRLIGLIRQSRLVQTMQEDAAADIGSMVGVSPQERALSMPWFAVKKRLPWLQINLLTAFLAAAVVGLFENTIAQFTALAVLLPVVAGQSGNAGAQALAVTMRGLALREVTTRQWFHVASKEVAVGLLNGVAVAATCGFAVWVWSQSMGLVLVISSSMILAMIAAGFAGAAVPMVLTRLGQDPAQSSSIILTTVTDIAGFFSFLGIATALSSLL